MLSPVQNDSPVLPGVRFTLLRPAIVLDNGKYCSLAFPVNFVALSQLHFQDLYIAPDRCMAVNPLSIFSSFKVSGKMLQVFIGR